jgi:hypothetical protein
MRVSIYGGTNRSLANDITLLVCYINTKKNAMNGIADDGPASSCTGLDYCHGKQMEVKNFIHKMLL